MLLEMAQAQELRAQAEKAVVVVDMAELVAQAMDRAALEAVLTTLRLIQH
jgi:hypothetical protein